MRDCGTVGHPPSHTSGVCTKPLGVSTLYRFALLENKLTAILQTMSRSDVSREERESLEGKRGRRWEWAVWWSPSLIEACRRDRARSGGGLTPVNLHYS